MTIKWRLRAAGYCTQIEKLAVRSGRWRTTRFYAVFAELTHPRHGTVLVDTGYTPRFHVATRQWPYRLYGLLTPTHVRPEETAVSQLGHNDVPHIILTHLHGDHTGGLRDFPQATYHYLGDGYAHYADLSPFAATRGAYLPQLMPADFVSRSRAIAATELHPLPPELAPFTHGIDIFGDGLVIGVPLPGHAVGQMGVFLRPAEGDVFLCADAVWDSRTITEENAMPAPPARLMQADWGAYQQTVALLRDFHRRRPDVPLLPCHCPAVYDRYVTQDTPSAT